MFAFDAHCVQTIDQQSRCVLEIVVRVCTESGVIGMQVIDDAAVPLVQ